MPLISETEIALLAETEKAAKTRCDFLEWRRDYFLQGEMLTVEEEIKILKKLKKRMGDRGVIYTFRSHFEGGAYETLDSSRLEAIASVVSLVDYVDVELESDPVFLKQVKEILKNKGCGLILSYHNFRKTPDGKKLGKIYDAMENQGANVLKLAVNPSSEVDVRQLIGASLVKNERTAKPIIAIAMGALGGITRIAPELCGGSLTYVAGSGKTALGQLNLEEIMNLRKSFGVGK